MTKYKAKPTPIPEPDVECIDCANFDLCHRLKAPMCDEFPKLAKREIRKKGWRSI